MRAEALGVQLPVPPLIETDILTIALRMDIIPFTGSFGGGPSVLVCIEVEY